MTQNTDYAGLIERLALTAQECRALIREMHEMQQALRADLREARDVTAELRAAVTEQVNHDVAAEIEAQVKKQVGELGEQTHKAMQATSRKIVAEFATLTKPLMEALGMLELAVELEEDKW
jgi:glucose-6-phosphate-specific signal transduction histidine kinase